MKIFTGTKEEYYMDGFLKSNLDIAKDAIKEDWDMCFLVDGPERSGKSVLSQQIAKYCDPTLTIDRITFTALEFRKSIINAKPYQAVIYDEAFTGLSSRAAMTIINRTLIQVLAEVGQKNLFIFVVMPTFFDIDKYVAIWRSRVLLNVYTMKGFERGYFNFFNFDRKKELYLTGKKFYDYHKPQSNFNGRFTNHYVVDEKAYRNKKFESLKNSENKREQTDRIREAENILFERVMLLGDKISHGVKMKILGMPSSTYFYKLKQYNDNIEMKT